MTPDPLPVALPELPTVAWLTCRSKDGKHVWEQGDSATNPDYVKAHPSFVWEPLVRKSDAEAALRAQAEEVAALRVLLVACERVAIRRGDKGLCDTIGQIGEHYQSSRLAVVLRANKQEKP